MTGLRAGLWVVFALFMAISIEVVWQFGFSGFLGWALYNRATTLVFVDLSIALAMMLSVMRRDASRHGRRFWPFLVLTLAFGSAGPLLYFALAPPSLGRNRDRATARQAQPSTSPDRAGLRLGKPEAGTEPVPVR